MGLKKVVIHLYNKQFRMPTMCDVCDEKIGGRGSTMKEKRKQ